MERHKQVTYAMFQRMEKRLNGTHVADSGFYRSFTFDALGNEYVFTFYQNQCHITRDGLQINFTHASIDGCWPNKYKENLNLVIANEIVAIIPLTEYKEVH